jgi:hypothetical protein
MTNTKSKLAVELTRYINSRHSHDECAGFADGFERASDIAEDEMHSNMQFYMEYCLKNEYITPMEWIKKHK